MIIMLITLRTKLTFLSALTLLILSVFADNELGVMRSLKTAYPDWHPRGIVDIGANRGGWTTNVQEIYPGVKTFMVEASPSHTGILNETKNKFKNIVDFLKGTKENCSKDSSCIVPSACLVKRSIRCASPSSTGITIMPPTFNC